MKGFGMRMFFGVGIILFLAFSEPALSQEVKSNPDLFRQCADYQNQMYDVKNYIGQANSRAAEMNRTHDELVYEIDTHKAEIDRLTEIQKIMQSSEEVRSKRNYAIDRYHQAFDEYENFMQSYKYERARYDEYLANKKSLSNSIRSQCDGTWSGNVLGKFCDTGEVRFQRFCARFN